MKPLLAFSLVLLVHLLWLSYCGAFRVLFHLTGGE